MDWIECSVSSDEALWGYIWEGCCPFPITSSQWGILYSEKFNIGDPENYPSVYFQSNL